MTPTTAVKTQHTPTPWKLELANDRGSNTIIVANDGNPIADCYPTQAIEDLKDAIANATFIVRAVNSHEALIHFVKEVKRVADDGLLTPAWSKMAKDLIAQAEGK